ncbi:MAG: hypothetical protein ABJA86_07965 [Nocardioidaceae bacterium]
MRRVLLPVLPGPREPDDRIAPFAGYFTDPLTAPLAGSDCDPGSPRCAAHCGRRRARRPGLRRLMPRPLVTSRVFPSWRGLGYDDALLAAGLDVLASEGSATAAVGADEDDWP